MSAQEPPVTASLAERFTSDEPSLLAPSLLAPSHHARRSGSSIRSAAKSKGLRAHIGLETVARRTLGIVLLLITVLLFTASSFLGSYVFADNTFGKPFFVTFLKTACFAFSLIPIFLRIAHKHGWRKIGSSAVSYWQGRFERYQRLKSNAREENNSYGDTPSEESSDTRLLVDDDIETVQLSRISTKASKDPNAVLSVRETTWLSLEFCLLWFAANYLVTACLEYTSVASFTVLTSTSSIWTLLFGAIFGIERFSVKKFIGVLASLIGIILISSVDLAGDNDDNRGKFPHKSPQQIAIGDTMAFVSAVLYGMYAIVIKSRIGNEDRVNMPLFFGMTGLLNLIFLWPGFLIIHYTGVEKFELPQTGKIWTIVLLNSAASFISDFAGAYAILLTTPLVVSVGLSLTIPLSLIGQMALSQQYSSALYWVGACIVLLSFLFINHESHDADETSAAAMFEAHEHEGTI